MKKVLLFSFLVWSSLYVSAQITVPASTFPASGDVLRYVQAANPNIAVALYTPPGGNQFWDLSGLTPASNSETNYRPAAEGVHAAQFPGAMMVVTSGTSEYYYTSSSTKFELLGHVDNTIGGLPIVGIYINQPIIAERRAPLNFFDIFQQTSNNTLLWSYGEIPVGALNLPVTADSLRLRINRQILDVVDGYGTLRLPGALPQSEFPVLRLKKTTYTTQNIDIKVQPLGWIDISQAGPAPGSQWSSLLGTDTIVTYHYLNDMSKEEIAVLTFNDAQNAVTSVVYKNVLPITDSDNDGIADNVDNCPLIANTDQLNTDGDAQGNACDTDDDNDGIADNVDNCPLIANTNQLNTDGDAQGNVCDPDDDNDGVADNVDNCPLNANTNQLNTDGDAQGNVCDPDDDNDGIADNVDNCPLNANPDQLNTDNDAQGNVCDTDDDNDGIADNVDNCPLTANTDQLNTDNDAQGNACDPDDDNDGIADNVDNCPLIANPNQSDIDNNGIGDMCDAKPTITDTDDDGIPENADNCPATFNPDQADADGDGIGDACDPCSTAIPNLANFNITTCKCDPGYYGIIGSLGFIKRCEPCPVGVNCSGNVNALILTTDNTNEVAGQQSQNNFDHGQGQNKPGHMDNNNMSVLEKPELMITPNPAADLVRFQLGQLSGQQDLRLDIYNSMGQLMLQKAFGKVSYLNEQIDIGSFSSGVYFVRVKAGELRIDQQLIVRKN